MTEYNKIAEALGIDPRNSRIKCSKCEEWTSTHLAIPISENDGVYCERCLIAENALLKKKLEIALRGLDEYGDEDRWAKTKFSFKDWWTEPESGYELARRIKAEIEEVK